MEAGLFLVDMVVLCQDLVQVKMRNFSQIQPARSSALVCAVLYVGNIRTPDCIRTIRIKLLIKDIL